MRRTYRWEGIVVVTALLLGSGIAPGVAQDKLAVIKQRQDFMKAQGGDVKAVTAFVKGQGDQAAAEKAAEDLVSRSLQIPDLFVAGTSSADFPGKTYAKPAIWQNMDKVKAIVTTLHDEEVKLAAAIKGGDRTAAGAALGAAGRDGCGACHGEFREKMP